jgi:hypothetical protein
MLADIVRCCPFAVRRALHGLVPGTHLERKRDETG